jgi:HlyD family secretion protein
MSESKSSEPDLSKLKISRDRGVAPAVSRRRYGKRIFIAVLILLLVAGLIARNVMAPVEVETATVSMAYRAQSYTLLNATGYVVAQRKAAVASKATGRLEWLGVREGSIVRRNEVLARLENRDVTASMEQAAASINVAQANLEQGEAEFKEASCWRKILSHRPRTIPLSGVWKRPGPRSVVIAPPLPSHRPIIAPRRSLSSRR